jgi:hypothetical protein
VTLIAPGDELSRPPEGWPAGVVEISHGEIELVCRGGTRVRFRAGELVWLRGIGLRAVRNVGLEVAELAPVGTRE